MNFILTMSLVKLESVGVCFYVLRFVCGVVPLDDNFGISTFVSFQLPMGVLLEQGCFTSHLLSFDNNKVLKIINWIC